VGRRAVKAIFRAALLNNPKCVIPLALAVRAL
jgi:hypothetical protein